MVMALLFSVSEALVTSNAGWVVSPLNELGVTLRMMALVLKFTVPPPLRVAAVEPGAAPVPRAFKTVLLLSLKVDTADTSKVPLAARNIFAELLMDPALPSASGPALMVVLPV